jgi:aminoglycoside phosphotransferase (APT) family kinase protein
VSPRRCRGVHRVALGLALAGAGCKDPAPLPKFALCDVHPPRYDLPMLSRADAERTVASLTAELGLVCQPRVIADRSNLVLALDPLPLVARVAMATSASRVGLEFAGREVLVARFLDAAGCAVTRPAAAVEPGPHEREGLVISLWEREVLEGELDPRLAGARLAECHRALAGLDRAVLPRWGGWEEARAVLDRALASPHLTEPERERVRRAWEIGERLVEGAAARSASMQAVHGDAHLGNVLGSTRGPVWTDWEDAFVGPVEWDLASLRSRADLFGEDVDAIEAACAGYGAPFDPGLVRELGLCRNLQVIPWLAVFAERDASLVPRLRARIARLP